MMHELLGKPDKDLDQKFIHDEQMQVDYCMDRRITDNEFHFDVVRRQLTRKLPLLTQAVYDELGRGFDQYWGTDSEGWTSVKVFPTCAKIVSRAANKVFAGEELYKSRVRSSLGSGGHTVRL